MNSFFGDTTMLFVSRVRSILLAAAATALSLGVHAQSGDPIKIGVIHSLTGGQAGIGVAAQHGTRAAVDYLNSQGGIMGRRVEVVIRDSGTNTSQAATAARELAADPQIVALFGSDLTGEVLAMAPPINARGLPSFQSAVAVSLYDPAQHCCFFLTGNTADQLSEYYVDYLTKNRGAKRLGIIYEGGAFGQASVDATQRALKAAGREPGVSESFQTGTADVTANLRKLRNAGVDGLVIHTFGPGLVAVLTSLQKLQWTVAATSPLGASSLAVREAVGLDGLKNIAAGPIPKSILTGRAGAPINEDARGFFESLRKVAGAEYSGDIIMSVFTFDKFLILKAAIEGAKSTDSKAIRDYLESGVPLKGVIGTYRYSKGSHIGLGIDRVGAFNPAMECSVKNACVAAQGVLNP
jgi:branched-chain amino acid transport system substrate-binding protein